MPLLNGYPFCDTCGHYVTEQERGGWLFEGVAPKTGPNAGKPKMVREAGGLFKATPGKYGKASFEILCRDCNRTPMSAAATPVTTPRKEKEHSDASTVGAESPTPHQD